ncbi:MAG: sulfatase, partial [bacterium]|nr:sulfatase [bacterium]
MSHRRRRWLLLGGFVLLVVVGLIAAKLVSTHSARAQRELPALNGANVVLVTLDTTRADRLGCYGYSGAETPYLDGLARDGVLFEHAVTPTAFTLPSHSSILTGYYPPYHGVRLNGHAALADVQVTLAEKLASAGYRTGAFVAAFVLDGRWGLEQGFEHYDDDFKLKTGQKLDLAGVQRTANQVVDATLGWLEQPDDRPFLAWLHLYDPHTPYDPPEPFKSRFGVSGPTGLEPGRLDDADDQASQMRAWRDQQSSLYDGEIAFADSQVGRVLDWLEVQGLADNTIVVVVGDHGEAIGSHGEIEHGYYVYDYAVKVPFLLKLPKGALAGLRVGSQVRTVDVLPTILQLVGVEGIHGIHGESVV